MSLSSVNYSDFIEAYMHIYKQGGTQVDLMKYLDLTRSSLSGRLLRLKQNDVILPSLRKKSHRFEDVVDIKRLNKIIQGFKLT